MTLVTIHSFCCYQLRTNSGNNYTLNQNRIIRYELINNDVIRLSMTTQEHINGMIFLIKILITVSISNSSLDALTIIFDATNANMNKLSDFGCVYGNNNNTTMTMNNILLFF